MKNSSLLLVSLYSILLILLGIYSYVLIDPNLTLLDIQLWDMFRTPLVQIGYHQRDVSWNIYMLILILLFLFHFIFVKKNTTYKPMHIAVIIGSLLFLSYPFLSHDLFNYIFDAKIFTFYGENPYLYPPKYFAQDDWLRFMHWTHRTYPYGPAFLSLSIVLSFMAMGKFILNFIFFKGLFVFFYLIAVYFLEKIDRRIGMIFATHPLIIIEGLVVTHNDLIATSLGIVGLFYLLSNNAIKGRLFLLLSAGIKFVTSPLLLLVTSKKSYFNYLVLIVQVGILLYLSTRQGIQPWYFLTLFVFLPIYKNIIQDLNIVFFGLLVSYYSYIRLGGLDSAEKVAIKDTIIYIALTINILYLLYKYGIKTNLIKNYFKKVKA